MEDYQDRLPISTPEGLQIDLVLAGLGSRFTAALVDFLLKILIAGAIVVISLVVGGFGVVLAIIAPTVVYIGYDIAFEVLASGQTPGKRRAHLRVMRADGRPIDLLSSAIRNVIRLVDGITLAYLPGMIAILLTRRNQRLGDLAGGTIVVVEEPEQAVADAPETPAWTQQRAVATAASGAIDVSAVTPEDLAALRSFLERRPSLPPAARTDIARRLAVAVGPRVGGGVGTLTDEALIESVVAAKDR